MSMVREAGFTIVELLIVIVVIGILLTIVGFTQTVALADARDSQRANDTASIARLLEDDYNDGVYSVAQAPSYPPADMFVNDSQHDTGTATGANPDIFQAPNRTGSSMVSATNGNLTEPRGNGSPDLTEYVYQPLHADGTVCNDLLPCVSFRLFYRTESNAPCPPSADNVCILESAHQQ